MPTTSTIFLSRLVPNEGNRDARRDLFIPYEMHRTLLRAFEAPGSPPGTGKARAGRLLYRIEVDGPPIVLVQSEGRPDWSLLPSDWHAAGGDPAIAEGLLAFTAGQHLRFRLRANPVKNLPRFDDDGNARRGKRVAVTQPGAQLAWLQRHLQRMGARLPEAHGEPAGVTMRDPHWDFVLKPGSLDDEHLRRQCLDEKGRPKRNLFGVLFDGALEVTDPQAFREGLRAGVGPGKSFGFGLLSVAPMRR